jgi:YVTN family beta-propeller protein
VSVIATATATVVRSITVGQIPVGVAATPDGSKVYVTIFDDNSMQVIDTATNTVVGSQITVGLQPEGVAVTPDGSKVYVTNFVSNSVSVIATATNTVIATIPVGNNPVGVAVTPDGSKVYVANTQSATVSVIATATDTVAATIPVGLPPFAFGIFIQPARPVVKFAGTPGKANCHGKSVSALAKQHGGLSAAAAALGFDSVDALQNAIMAFCGG